MVMDYAYKACIALLDMSYIQFDLFLVFDRTKHSNILVQYEYLNEYYSLFSILIYLRNIIDGLTFKTSRNA
jgi:hypothetical protein